MSNESIELPPRDAEQIRRARVLLEQAKAAELSDTQFVLRIGALHLARSIPEYWYTVAELIPQVLNKTGREKADLAQRLRDEFEEVFYTARRYELLTDLRQWDFHWEPLINAETMGPGCTYGRGAPLRLSAGPGAGNAVYTSARGLVTTGSGRRVGRANYYRIQKSRYVDFQRSEAVPLELAIREFIDDLPTCIGELLRKPEFIEYQKAHE